MENVRIPLPIIAIYKIATPQNYSTTIILFGFLGFGAGYGP
jgi:hypothetical protein